MLTFRAIGILGYINELGLLITNKPNFIELNNRLLFKQTIYSFNYIGKYV